MSTPVSVIIPQPSTSSRSTKVIEHLSDKYEFIQKEIASTKSQLDLMRQAKLQFDTEAINHANSNKIYRVKIKEVMQVLESKQKLLDGTKGTSVQLESRVKQLKDEALASRRQLEDLRKRELVLEHDRDMAIKERNQTKQKQQSMQDSVEQLRIRHEREVTALQNDQTLLSDHARYLTERNERLVKLVTMKMNTRQQSIEHLTKLKVQLQTNTAAFVKEIDVALQTLKFIAEQSISESRNYTVAAYQCRSEVNALFARIKAIAAEITASQNY
ncbi:hypothetical protein BDF20DRAFT_915895 [Mycotypha africana]|uniref:uncharacterized protein n=1 Tax=Mycotypha africana TaxID=64632 RepID=UPI0023014F88|nr:uncharacterized protein BDF20DRAFT_915895 [Mycotypha africana]KAI8970018.1 hypothetical protein BDF20DRAFT_915895 [Mycotypha africana]